MSMPAREVLISHQGPYFDGVSSSCSCGATVKTGGEWADHVADKLEQGEFNQFCRNLADTLKENR